MRVHSFGCIRSGSGRAAARLTAWQRLRHLWVLDELRRPIKQEVFMRMLSYYEISSQTERPNGAPAKKNAAQHAVATLRRMQ
jgi:hypothetical protein